MKVAVPLFRDEVSPRFGCSAQFLVATVEEGGVWAQEVKDVSHLAPWQLSEFLASLGVTKVICGGVHRRFQEELARCGIEIIWGVIGPAADALEALRAGTLRTDQFICPGWRGGRGGGRGQGRGRGGRGRGGPAGQGGGPGQGQA